MRVRLKNPRCFITVSTWLAKLRTSTTTTKTTTKIQIRQIDGQTDGWMDGWTDRQIEGVKG